MKNNLYGEAEASAMNAKQSTDSCWILKDLKATIDLGRTLTVTIPNFNLLLLEGPLGAGKTSLVKGIAMSLGIYEPITSPSFPLAQHYPAGKPPLFHLDLYRLNDPNDADELFIQEEEEANDIGALMVVEWPERLNLQLEEAWTIKLEHHISGGRWAQLIPPHRSDKNAITSS